MIDFIVHREHDTVGVVVRDVTQDQSLTGWNMETDATLQATAREGILLGHKIALFEINRGEKIIKYNVPIGLATEDISAGQHVHIHNLKTARW